MDVSTGTACLALGALGVLSHLTFFIHMDPVDSSPTLGLLAIAVPASITVALKTLFKHSYFDAAFTSAAWWFSYVGAVLGSMVIYRLFFHRLRKYPGPAGARITQFWHVAKIWKGADHYRQIDKLHQQYGEYVRAGPNLLSISDPDIVDVVHAANTGFDKSNWYEAGKPLTTLHQMTDRRMHDKRRRHGWDKAFTTKAIRSYDQRLIKYTNQLVGQLHARAGTSVDARSWINYLTFDIMGDLAFGKSFQALEKGESHFFIDLIHESGLFPGLLGSVPWVLHCMTKLPIPASVNAFLKMLSHSMDMVKERKTYKPEEPDVMSYLLEAGDFFDNPETEMLLLTGDARLLIVAGSDTTATTLTYCLYQFAKDPSVARKLREELEKHNIRKDENFTVLNLTNLEYLNALINETLRLYPPVPGGTYRKAPKEGATVNGHFIPGGCTVLTPQHTIQRSPKAFGKSDEFIPERWTTEPDLIINKNAWFPFVIGRYGCIGKQLALNELRTVISRLVLEFDVKFAKGEDGSTLLEKTEDVFTTCCAKLDLVFTPRK